MKPNFKSIAVAVLITVPFAATSPHVFAASPTQGTVSNGKVQDYGPLAALIGTWKTVPDKGEDVAPGQTGSPAGRGGKAVSPYYEIITVTPNIPDTNNSVEHLVSVLYHQTVYRTTNHHQFHDQFGYLTYDRTNNLIYDTSCVPRSVCFVAEGRPGNPMTLTTKSQGVAQAQYMVHNDSTKFVKVTFSLSGDKMKYRYKTHLFVYGKPFVHTDEDILEKVNN
ncbi:heme-binding beta-barrel domain-containing protein [Paraburkholderia terrae]|uniref:heme-binding beta-barrel domain-containing protein n=1 Tax=Paraburkholderia terrae TaxID=311230 RepID=UPI0020C11456|nr:heme-binding beta-barrel domain-containing protein [Paraburkholderia terrae]